MHLNKSVYTGLFMEYSPWKYFNFRQKALQCFLKIIIPLAKIDNITNLPDISRLASA